MTTYRAWINQPSTLQSHHKMHGLRCIVQDDGNEYLRVWFTDGDTHSAMVNRSALSRIHISSAG